MFIDANIFISAALGRDKKGERCRDFLRRVEKGEQHSITSVLVFDEVLNSLEAHTGSAQESESLTRKFISIPNLKICEVNLKHFEYSLSFFKSGLRPRDALHAAVMLEHGVPTILSYDRDFDAIKSIKRIEP